MHSIYYSSFNHTTFGTAHCKTILIAENNNDGVTR